MKPRFFLLAITLAFSTISYSYNVTMDELSTIATTMNKNLPKQIDSSSELKRVSTEGSTFHYYFQVTKPIQIDQTTMAESLKTTTCSDDFGSSVLGSGINISFEFDDANGHLLRNVLVTPKDCNK